MIPEIEEIVDLVIAGSMSREQAINLLRIHVELAADNARRDDQ